MLWIAKVVGEEMGAGTREKTNEDSHSLQPNKQILPPDQIPVIPIAQLLDPKHTPYSDQHNRQHLESQEHVHTAAESWVLLSTVGGGASSLLFSTTTCLSTYLPSESWFFIIVIVVAVAAIIVSSSAFFSFPPSAMRLPSSKPRVMVPHDKVQIQEQKDEQHGRLYSKPRDSDLDARLAGARRGCRQGAADALQEEGEDVEGDEDVVEGARGDGGDFWGQGFHAVLTVKRSVSSI